MRPCRDSFIAFFTENLAPVIVQQVRRDPNNIGLGTLQVNAVNLQFLRDQLGVSIAKTTVSIDVIHNDESACIGLVQSVWSLLSTVGSIPKLDYSSGTPVPVGTAISWDPQNVPFRSIYSDAYFRYSCLLVLTHHPTL